MTSHAKTSSGSGRTASPPRQEPVVTRNGTAGPSHGPEPGEATRRFLAATGAGRPPVPSAGAQSEFRHHPGAPVLPLPTPAPLATGAPGLAPLAHLLHDLLGVTALSWSHPVEPTGGPGPVTLRAHRPVASGGALYPMEVYLAAGPPWCAAGLYSYDALHHALELLRPGDHGTALRRSLAEPATDATAPLLLLSAVFWRGGTKYRDFAYRLMCQETGALAAQAAELAREAGLRARLHTRFDGRGIDRALSLRPDAEGVLAAIELDRITEPAGDADTCPGRHGAARTTAVHPRSTRVPEAQPPAMPVGDLLPHLLALHRTGTSLPQPAAGPPALPALRPPDPAPSRRTAVPLGPAAPPPLAEGTSRRRSAPSGFSGEEVDCGTLTRLLAAAAAGYSSDLPGSSQGMRCCAVYVIALRVPGVPAGAYRYDAAGGLVGTAPWHGTTSLFGPELLPQSDAALSEAAFVVLPVGDPLTGSELLGDGWYRWQQAEAGILTHRAALAAASAGLSARILSDVANPTTDDALGLAGSPYRTLCALLVGRTPARTPARWAGSPRSTRAL